MSDEAVEKMSLSELIATVTFSEEEIREIVREELDKREDAQHRVIRETAEEWSSSS